MLLKEELVNGAIYNMEDKLRKYIREYVMFLYKQKENPQLTYHFKDDVDHPIQQGEYPSNNVLPTTYNRRYHGMSIKGRY